ncbi:MAG TPA: SRPBCC domain-containing protein [Acidimicrobiia bacterium]
MVPEPYRGSFELPASSSTVFAHLTMDDLLAAWWPDGADTDPTPGGRMHLWWDGPGWHLRGEYLEVEPPERLVYTWKWDHDDLPERRVVMTLSVAGSGTTRVDIEHDAGSDEERQSHAEGWEFFLGQLRELLTAG